MTIEKKLNFYVPLPEMVLSGVKDTTWRIDDDKGLMPGDVLLCTNHEPSGSPHKSLGPFARAKVLWIKETTFGALTLEDKAGNEPFASDVEGYATYGRYYGQVITPDTRLKVVKYKVFERL